MAECRTQTSLEEFADTTDPAMERTVERLSAAVEAYKASGTHSSRSQRKETTSGLSSDRAHVQGSGAVLALTGDSGHEKGGTRELRVKGEVHSTSPET